MLRERPDRHCSDLALQHGSMSTNTGCQVTDILKMCEIRTFARLRWDAQHLKIIPQSAARRAGSDRTNKDAPRTVIVEFSSTTSSPNLRSKERTFELTGAPPSTHPSCPSSRKGLYPTVPRCNQCHKLSTTRRGFLAPGAQYESETPRSAALDHRETSCCKRRSFWTLSPGGSAKQKSKWAGGCRSGQT